VHQITADFTTEVAGESYRASEIGRLMAKWGLKGGGVTMRQAVLVPEPSNRYDRNAVKVVIEGEHVGYVPADQARMVGDAVRKAPRGEPAGCPARIWAIQDGGQWRARITLDFAEELAEPDRDFATEASSQREYADRWERSRREGEVRGAWWKTHQGAVVELKRQGRFDEALALADECAAAAERVAVATREVPDKWPVEQQSMILRKLGDAGRELAALERFVAACGDREVPESVLTRLARARVASER
jgi:hypothetical protein